MRLSDLVGRAVVTTEGTDLGHVHEVLLVQDGPVLSETAAAFRVHGLAVGKRAFGARLGYVQGTVTGPSVLHRLFRHTPTIVPWRAIVSLDDDNIVVDATDISR